MPDQRASTACREVACRKVACSNSGTCPARLLASSRQKTYCLSTPTSPCLNPKHHQPAQLRVSALIFFAWQPVLRHVLASWQLAASADHHRATGNHIQCQLHAPPQRSRPLATTSMRMSSCTTSDRFVSLRNTFWATLAPASRQTRAAATSQGVRSASGLETQGTVFSRLEPPPRLSSGTERQHARPRGVSEVQHELECRIVRRCARRRQPRPTCR